MDVVGLVLEHTALPSGSHHEHTKSDSLISPCFHGPSFEELWGTETQDYSSSCK